MRKRGRPLENKSIYPVLYTWIIENFGSIYNFSKSVDMSDKALRTLLYGEGGCYKHTIDMILEITGLTYEEAFKEAE